MWRWYDSAIYGLGVAFLGACVLLLAVYLSVLAVETIALLQRIKPENERLRREIADYQDRLEMSFKVRRALEAEVEALRKVVGYRDADPATSARPESAKGEGA